MNILELLNSEVNDDAPKPHNKLSFCTAIHRMVEDEAISYIEALTKYIEENDMDEKAVAKLLDSTIKQNIKKEAYEMNLIRTK